MHNTEQYKAIVKALNSVRDAYRTLAQAEMVNGSPHSVYFAMRESIAAENKARQVEKNWLRDQF